MQKLKSIFNSKKKLLTVYFTAGFPNLDSTGFILEELQNAGVDAVEIGIPFSDSLVDGETIQESNLVALQNGMTLNLLLKQLAEVKDKIKIPVILMGGINPILSYGIENFVKEISEIGIDATIIPDLPIREYQELYLELFNKYNVSNIFLISPQTSNEKIKMIDSISSGFIYAVSSYSVTGNALSESKEINEYFGRIDDLKLKTPVMVGFGIRDKNSFEYASKKFAGGIVGTEFIKCLGRGEKISEIVSKF